jgi:transposase
MSLAGLSGCLWSTNDGLQSFQPMGSPRPLAEDVQSPGGVGRKRHPVGRQHQLQSPSFRRRRKRGAAVQAIGRSRGGRTTKIHAVADGRGRIIAFELTAGQLGDLRAVTSLIGPLPPARLCAADAAYDSNGFRYFLSERGTLPVIPNIPARKRLHPFDRQPYKLRNLIERAFCFLKDWRRIATRYDKLAATFEAAIAIAAIILWWC